MKYVPISITAVLIIASASVEAEQSSFAAAVQQVLPCVVRVLGESTKERILANTAESVTSAEGKVYSVGSGFYVTADGQIATAHHVIAPVVGKLIVESNHTGQVTTHLATIIAQDRDADIALIKVEGNGYPHVLLHDPLQLPIGEDVGFAGYPLLSPFTMVNRGVISAKANMPVLKDHQARNLLVVSAFINPGNSGGPLFRAVDGTVIGVINARKVADVEERMIKLPSNYAAAMTIGGIDPIKLSVETYNSSLALIGDVSQFGIGYCASIEYLVPLVQK